MADKEKQAIEIIGYLVDQRLEKLEACNCGSTNDIDHDFHLWLTAKPDEGKPDSVVAEVSPLVREHHPAWTKKGLSSLVGKRLRVSGLVMFDQEHADQLGKHRKGLWEIHPIYKIETFSGGAWHEF